MRAQVDAEPCTLRRQLATASAGAPAIRGPAPDQLGLESFTAAHSGAGIDASQKVAKVPSILGGHSRRGNFGNTSLPTTLEAAWLLGFSHYPAR